MAKKAIPGSKKMCKKTLAISTETIEYAFHTKLVWIQPKKNMKSILTEIVLFGEAIVFWAVALPAAIVVFPALALWEKIGTALA